MWFQLSTVAFKFNLRRYNEERQEVADHYLRSVLEFTDSIDDLERQHRSHAGELEVGRCRLSVSKPVLQAPMVSALEARI